MITVELRKRVGIESRRMGRYVAVRVIWRREGEETFSAETQVPSDCNIHDAIDIAKRKAEQMIGQQLVEEEFPQ